MKHLLHFLWLAFFAATTLVLSSCGDDKKVDPAPTTGTVNGQITPANSITTVTAASTATPATTATATPNASGAYSFTTLAAGTYTLSFTPAAGFTAPATQTVTVTAGGTATATPVTTATGNSNNSATFTVGGVTSVASLVLGNFQFTNLSVTIASASGRSVVFTIEGFAGTTGTFSLANQLTTSTQLIYSEQVGTTAQQWTTAGFLSNNQGSGNIVITAIGTNPRRASGTFTAVAYPATSASTGTRTITGSFTNVSY